LQITLRLLIVSERVLIKREKLLKGEGGGERGRG